MKKFFTLILASASLGCITPQEKRDMRSDISGVQTRLIALEQAGQERDKSVKSTGEQASQKIANTGVELEKIQRELAKLRGEIDSLRIGVVTGKMPGAEGVAEGSLAAQIQTLTTKIDSLEQNQRDMLEQIEKLATREPTKKEEKSKKGKDAKGKEKDAKDSAIHTLKDLRTAYGKGRYKQVAESGNDVLKASDSKEKEEVLYLHAESLYKTGQMRDSALKFNEMLDLKGASGKHASQAKLRLGDCFRHLGDSATAKLYYDEVLTKFPSSAEASKAKERLGEMQKGSASKQ